MAGSKLCRAGDPRRSRARRRWADRHPEERPWADSRREPGARANPQAPGARTQDRNAKRRLVRSAAMGVLRLHGDRKSTRLNSSHLVISYAVFCLKKKKTKNR